MVVTVSGWCFPSISLYKSSFCRHVHWGFVCIAVVCAMHSHGGGTALVDTVFRVCGWEHVVGMMTTMTFQPDIDVGASKALYNPSCLAAVSAQLRVYSRLSIKFVEDRL